MHKCLSEAGGWQYPVVPPLEDGELKEFSLSCSDPLKKDRFCKYNNLCLLNQIPKHFQSFSSQYEHEIFGEGKSKYDTRVSDSWWIRHTKDIPANTTVITFLNKIC